MDLTRRQRRDHRRPLAAIAAAIAALVAVAVCGPAQAASASPAADRCNHVEFLGARGSGQALDYSGPFKGLGPQSYKVVTTVAARLSAKRISYGVDAIPYPADSVNDLKPSTLEILGLPESLPLYYKDNVSKFLGSIATGVSDMVS